MAENPPRGAPTDVVSDRMRRAQAVAHVGSWEIELSSRRMWGSEEAFRIYGFETTPGQIMPLELVQTVPLPGFRPILDRALMDLIAGRGPYDVEFEILRSIDGERRVIHSLAELVRGPDGTPTTVIGTLQDVTERRAMEDALRASELRFRMILEHSADAILLGDAQGVVIELNEQACELTGYSRAELLGSHASMLFAAAERDRAPLRFDLLDRGEALIIERILTRKDGTTVPVEMHSKRLPDGVYQSIYRDITARRRLEEQLHLRQRMDSIGALASGIAHDFNNILVAIVGYAELLREEARELSASSRETIRKMLLASRRASDLVGRLQGLSHPDRAAVHTFDLHKVASEVVQMLAETTDRRIRVELAIEPRACLVYGSESDIYHALVNLGLNGVQAIEAKGTADGDLLRIEAELHVAPAGDTHGLAPGDYVHLRVSDTGSGMSPEVKARAFDPLFSTKPRGVRKGQGLGLTMVYQTVTKGHGGAIDVDTEEGKGTVFHLFLPAGRGCPADVAAAPPTESVAQRSATILLIEDELQIVDISRRVLERAGHRVITALDGARGVDEFTLHASEIDLVILDQTLPKLNGTQVMKEIARIRPGTKVILSSGTRLNAVREEALQVSMLPKPYAPVDLLAAVWEALK